MRTFIIFLGPQGSGKGTQAKIVAQKLHWPLISTGGILRQEMENKTEIGEQIFSNMTKGYLVKDEVVNQIVHKIIEDNAGSDGFVLDGYPRNSAQAQFFGQFIKPQDKVLVFNIVLSDKEALSRIVNRLSCICGASYNKITAPPQKEGVCDFCGRSLFVRHDDQEKIVKQRLSVYHELIEELLAYFKQQFFVQVIAIDGEQSIDNIAENIAARIS